MRTLLASLVVLFAAPSLAACGGSVSSDSHASETDAGSQKGLDSGLTDGAVPPASKTCSQGPSSCTLARPGCCNDSCGPASELVAIRAGEEPALKEATCKQTEPLACKGCDARPDPAVFAYCAVPFGGAATGECAVMNVADDNGLSACSSDADCALRHPGCCECDNPDDVIALRKDATSTYTGAACGGVGAACPSCALVYPQGTRASCNTTTHRCAVTR